MAARKGPDLTTKARLVLADGHPIVLAGLQHVLEAEADFEVVASCTTAGQALDAALQHDAAVLVLDSQLPPHGGLPLVRALARREQPPRLVWLTSAVIEEECVEAVRLGVKGIALKEMPLPLVLECIRQVSRGATWIETGSIGAVVEGMRRHVTNMQGLKERLTPREMEILGLVADGAQTKDLTTRLQIAEGTVRIHLHNIYGKLGINNRLQLALHARGGTLT